MKARAPPGSIRIPSGAFPSTSRFTCFREAASKNDQLSTFEIAYQDMFAIESELQAG